MFESRSKIAAGLLILSGMLSGVPGESARAADTPEPAKNRAAGISAERFDALRTLIKPRPGGFDDLPWMTDLWDARQKAAAEGKPLLVWVGDGHPLGWT
jgi:hypothetical protein